MRVQSHKRRAAEDNGKRQKTEKRQTKDKRQWTQKRDKKEKRDSWMLTNKWMQKKEKSRWRVCLLPLESMLSSITINGNRAAVRQTHRQQGNCFWCAENCSTNADGKANVKSCQQSTMMNAVLTTGRSPLLTSGSPSSLSGHVWLHYNIVSYLMPDDAPELLALNLYDNRPCI